MDLIIASNNAHKIREIKEILGKNFDAVCSMRDAGIELDVVEDGETFIDNALLKANALLALLKKGNIAVLADDSGLWVDALNGAPGVYSARFAGEGHDDKANNTKLLNLMKDVPDNKRSAKFVCAMVLARHNHQSIKVQGECYGQILHELHGENGFGYDPLFFYPEFNRSFAELTPAQKNQVSHRRHALDLVLDALND